MVILKVKLTYNKANERWDLRTKSGHAILDSQQKGMPDCSRVDRVFGKPNKEEENDRILIVLDPYKEHEKLNKIMQILKEENQ